MPFITEVSDENEHMSIERKGRFEGNVAFITGGIEQRVAALADITDEEVRLASRRPDGTLCPYVTIWILRVGDGLYVRSAYRLNNPWFRRAETI